MSGPLCKHGWSLHFCGPCSADHFFKSQAKGPRDGGMLAMEPENVPEATWRAAMSAYHKTLRKNPTMAWQEAVSAALKADNEWLRAALAETRDETLPEGTRI